MAQRNRTMDQYRVAELLRTMKRNSSTTNPSDSGVRRACLVLDAGELGGNFGYRAEDEEDSAEGFLHALGNVVWSGMPMIALGIKEASKEEEPEKEKVKAENERKRQTSSKIL